MDATENIRRPPAVSGIIRRYYTVWMTYSLAGGFLFGVYPIFLKTRGLDQFEINSVLATYFVVLFLTDVPTGAFADALGRRRSFVLGAALRVCAFLLYFTAHHYWVFLIGESIDGIGTTFGNGAIDAWGVDALDDAGFEGLKDALFSRISQLTTVGFMISSIGGAYIADIDIAYPWLCGAAGYLVAAVIGVCLMTGERPRAHGVDLAGMPQMIVRRVVEGVRAGLNNRTVLMLSAAGAIQFAAWSPYWLEWPILFHEGLGVGVWIIGWIYCGLSIARMIGAEAVTRISSDEHSRAGRVSALIGMSGLMLAAAGIFQLRPPIALTFLFVMNICTGAITPMLQSWFNEQIDSSQRATMLSFQSTFGTMGGSIGLIINGMIADRAGVGMAWQFAGALTLAAIPCYLAIRPRAARLAIVEPVAK
jgi:MFS family permease